MGLTGVAKDKKEETDGRKCKEKEVHHGGKLFPLFKASFTLLYPECCLRLDCMVETPPPPAFPSSPPLLLSQSLAAFNCRVALVGLISPAPGLGLFQADRNPSWSPSLEEPYQAAGF